MIVNTIMFKLKEPNSEHMVVVQEKLLSMKGNIEQLKDITVNINVRPGASAFDIVMIAKYASMQEFLEYIAHPLHANVGEYVLSMCEQTASVCYEE